MTDPHKLEDALKPYIIGYDKGSDDNSALCFREGERIIGIVHGELADAIYSMIKNRAPEAEQQATTDEVMRDIAKFAIEYCQAEPRIYGRGFKTIPDLAARLSERFPIATALRYSQGEDHIQGENWEDAFIAEQKLRHNREVVIEAKDAQIKRLVEALEKVQDWLGQEMFDDDERHERYGTQEERAEDLSDKIREALAQHAADSAGEG